MDCIDYKALQEEAKKRMDLLGVGKFIYNIKELSPSEPHLLTKVSPEWFVSHTTVRLGYMTFTSGAEATVSVFVCPGGFTASSWLTMLMSANWDTMDGWIMDRCKVEGPGIHETVPCSTKDAYQLGPDDSVFVVNHGLLPITDITIALVLPTYKQILSDVTSLSVYQPRPSPSQVSYEWSTIQAAKRTTINIELVKDFILNATDNDVRSVCDYINKNTCYGDDDDDSDSD